MTNEEILSLIVRLEYYSVFYAGENHSKDLALAVSALRERLWNYDISSAPNDGTQFIIYDPNRPEHLNDPYQFARHIYADDDGSGADAIGALWSADGRESVNPIAWMPKPDEPTRQSPQINIDELTGVIEEALKSKSVDVKLNSMHFETSVTLVKQKRFEAAKLIAQAIISHLNGKGN